MTDLKRTAKKSQWIKLNGTFTRKGKVVTFTAESSRKPLQILTGLPWKGAPRMKSAPRKSTPIDLLPYEAGRFLDADYTRVGPLIEMKYLHAGLIGTAILRLDGKRKPRWKFVSAASSVGTKLAKSFCRKLNKRKARR